METMQIVIEPQRICPCGKSYLPLNVQERAAYDEAIRRIEEDRGGRAGEESSEKGGDHSEATERK